MRNARARLRKQGSLASELQVFAHTSPLRPGPRFNRSVVVPLRRPTAGTGDLVLAANHGTRHIYAEGYNLIKAGVMLLDLCQPACGSTSWTWTAAAAPNAAAYWGALDAINRRHFKGMVHLISAGTTGKVLEWGVRQRHRAPQHTTKLEHVYPLHGLDQVQISTLLTNLLDDTIYVGAISGM